MEQRRDRFDEQYGVEADSPSRQPNEETVMADHHQYIAPLSGAEAHAATTSFKRPPSLKPMIPICIYVILSSAGPSMVFPILPRQRKEYFGSDSTAALWGGLCESLGSMVGLFLGGIFGLAADGYGRKRLLVISCWVAMLPYVCQVTLGASYPWPFMVLSNCCLMIGSTQFGNTAVGFMVLADLFEPDCRLLPTIIYTIMLFVGVMTAPIPSLLQMSDTETAIAGLVVLCVALIFVWWGFQETLPPVRRKRLSSKDFQNPLAPLRQVFRSDVLTSLAMLCVCIMLPFNADTAIQLYYLHDKLGGAFSDVDNGLLASVTGFSFILSMVVLLPLLARWMHATWIVMLGAVMMTLNAVVHCVIREKWQAFAFLPTTLALAFVSMPMLSQMVSVIVASDEQGVVNGCISAVRGVAVAFGPLVGTLLYLAGTHITTSNGPLIELPYVFSTFVGVLGIWVVWTRILVVPNRADERVPGIEHLPGDE